jgi:hypothetical protein
LKLCLLSDKGNVELIAALSDIIKHDEGWITIVDLRPLDGRAEEWIEIMGFYPLEMESKAF